MPANGSALDIVLAIDNLVRDRFFHGYSRLRFCDNWLANLSSYLWSDLGAPVRPDDILRYRRAACSQQAIVVQALLKANGLRSASVRMDGHFSPAVMLDGKWLVLDPNRESTKPLFPLSALAVHDEAYDRLYPKDPPKAGTARLTDIDRNPAPNATLFHDVTDFLSSWGWLLLGLLYAATSLRLWRFAGLAWTASRRSPATHHARSNTLTP